MIKILDILRNHERPYEAITELYENGELKTVLPELYNLHTDEKGYKNNFIHTMGVLKNVCDTNNEYWMKLVALFHDIGKPTTKRYTDEKGWTFHNHELIGAEMTMEILNRCDIHDYKFRNYIYRMILHHGRTKMHRDVSEAAIRRLDKEVGPDIIFDVIEFCKCDITTKFEDKRNRITSALDTIKKRVIEVREKDKDAKWRSPLTGHLVMEILEIGEGRIVGEIKKELDPMLKSGEITLEEAKRRVRQNWSNNAKSQ